MSENRIVRSRHEADLQLALRARHDLPDSGRKIVGSVFNGGAMPTTVPAWFFTHPADFGCTETEGGSCSPEIDTANTVPILVLGPKVPGVGDLLPARMIGGKWVTGSGGTPPNNCCMLPCSPCPIPQKNLQLIATNPLTGNETLTLAYNGLGWSTGCSADGVQFQLLCTGGQIELRVTYWLSGSCPGTGTTGFCSNLQPAPHALTLSSQTCSPFSLTFNLTSTTCPPVVGNGYTKFVVSDPAPASNPPGLMCQKFCATGLTSDATVTVTQSGTTVATGTIVHPASPSTSACVSLSWQGSPGTYSWSAVSGGTTIASGTSALACNGTTTFCTSVQQCCTICNWGTLFPTLTVTDSFQSVVCHFNGSAGFPVWQGCYVIPPTIATPTTTELNCQVPSGGSGTLVRYVINCDSAGNIGVVREWSTCGAVGDVFCLSTYNASTCTPDVHLGASCSLTCLVTGSKPAGSCSPFPLSFALSSSLGSNCTHTGSIFTSSVVVDS